jgi:hypothetical protein
LPHLAVGLYVGVESASPVAVAVPGGHEVVGALGCADAQAESEAAT